MEDVFICISLSENFGDFINQTDWPDLNLNWLIDYCFYYFTAWLSGYMYLFFFLWKERLYELLKPPFKNWVTILVGQKKNVVGLRNKDPLRFCPGEGGGTPLYKLYIGTRRPIR